MNDNQTMKFDHLIEYNMRNIFPVKSYTNVVEKLVPNFFLKNQNWDQQPKISYRLFLLPKSRAMEIY